MATIISPSILSADFAHLGRDIAMLQSSAAEWIHIDVMDGVFVPNISFGFPVLQAVRKLTTKHLDVHLMIVQPELYISQFQKAGADHITIHYEGAMHLDYLIRLIQAQGITAGVAINPATPVSVLSEVIQLLDVVLVMSVNPGFGGQQFLPHTIDKVKQLKALIGQRKSSAKIEVDGGVNINNATSLIAAGADILVAGNAVFADANPLEMIEKLLNS